MRRVHHRGRRILSRRNHTGVSRCGGTRTITLRWRGPRNPFTRESDALRLPAVYPVMITLAMLPPVWHAVMDLRLPRRSQS